ncbi:hypothetical protein HII36_46495 [Nonomuraea sp. NN258]|uniref:hypothetical protein n=1 Tax=Nonomuraea antri TaxID=2730852 RepID=UPI001569A39E|nr:hypothetical protein [Nonomuraea antri]NRQ39224.1 hypothetical protein [Nonomuraea antri]
MKLLTRWAEAVRRAGGGTPPRPAHVRVLFGLPGRPGTCPCLLDLPHDRRAHPRD